MLKGVSDIIKAVGNSPRKMWTMIIVLFFVSAVTVADKYFSTDDCSSYEQQNSTLVKSQSELVNQNQLLVSKNSELLEGYAKLQSLVNMIKPDTVYVSRFISPKSIQVNTSIASDVVSLDSVNVEPTDSLKPIATHTTSVLSKYSVNPKIKYTPYVITNTVHKKNTVYGKIVEQMKSIISNNVK